MKKFQLPALAINLCIASLFLVACEKDGKEGSENKGIVFNPAKTYGTVSDIDSNSYKTIVIGTQKWMAENLKTSKYANGDDIMHIEEDIAWQNTLEGAWTYYGNNVSMNSDYGKLYNWYAVHDSRNICPAGWHIPNDQEWETLLAYLDGYLLAGAKMKETGTNHFVPTNQGSTNESGFTGLPGGMREYDSYTHDKGMTGFFWSATVSNDYYQLDAYYYFLSRDMDNTLDGIGDRNNGCSCRCIEDVTK